MSAPRNLFFSLLVAAAVAVPGLSLGQDQQVEVVQSGDVVQLKPDHPTRYTVVTGDTLWDIASRFLQSPWHWPRIWKINEQIANPHLIYPGDVIVLRFVDGRPELTVVRDGQPGEVPLIDEDLPISEVLEGVAGAPNGIVVRLSPKVLSKPLAQPIPTISPEVILPFLTRPLFVDDDQLEKSGYVTIGLDDRIALGDNSEFYARGLPEDADTEFYLIYRKGTISRAPMPFWPRNLRSNQRNSAPAFSVGITTETLRPIDSIRPRTSSGCRRMLLDAGLDPISNNTPSLPGGWLAIRAARSR